MKKVIKHNGMTFHFKCRYADGAFYETEDGRFYVLTDATGDVDLCSNVPLGSCQSE